MLASCDTQKSGKMGMQAGEFGAGWIGMGWAGSRESRQLTRNNITRVHGIFVLDETKAVHQLDLGDFASAMGREMGLNIILSGLGEG